MFEASRLRFTHRIAILVGLVALTALAAHARHGEPGSAPTQLPIPTPNGPARIEVAFVLDTTGSMSGLLEGAKHKIWSIANQLATGQPTPEIRFGLIGYRDRGDRYVTTRFDLSADIDALYGRLFGFRAEGGGDTPESVNQALHEAVTKLSWSNDPEVYRVIFLVGDAPPHLDYQDDVPYSESVKLARAKDIVVNTIQCGSLGDTTPVWRRIAQGGHGEYVAIAQDGAMVAIAAPVDDELAHLNRELAGTVLAYGARAEKDEIHAKRRAALEAPAPVAASRLSYLDKIGGYVNSGRRDLVDAIREGLVDLSALSPAELPEEMQSMDRAEQESFVQQQLAKRQALQRRISELAEERDTWVRAETERLAAAGKADGFDQKVLGAIRAQAAEKGIAYE